MKKENKEQKIINAFAKVFISLMLVYAPIQLITQVFKMQIIYKYGEQFITEIIMALIVIIFVLIANMGYIFTEKKKN